MAASISSGLLGKGFEVVPGFMFRCLSQGDDMHVVPTFRGGQVHDLSPPPAQQADSLSAVRVARIRHGEDRMIERRIASLEVQPMGADVGLALLLIPGHHRLKCSYK